MLCQAAGNRRQNHIIGKQADTQLCGQHEVEVL